MNNEKQDAWGVIQNNYQLFIALTIAYFGICSVLYHFSFWGTFHINYLHYIQFSDIIKDAVYPIYISASGISISIGVSMITILMTKEKETKPEKPTNENTQRFKNIVFAIITFGMLLLRYIPVHELFHDLFTIFIFPIVTAYTFESIPQLSNINSRIIRIYILFLFFYIPLNSFYKGKTDANQILSSPNLNVTIELKTEENEKVITEENEPIYAKFIGNTNDYLFLTDSSNRHIMVLPVEQIRQYSIRKS